MVQFFQHPLGWLRGVLFQGTLADPLRLIQPLLQLPLSGSAQLHSVWQAVAAAASGLVAVAALARALRMALAVDARPASALIEVAIRAGLSLGLVQLSYDGLLWAYQASSAVSAAILGELLHQAGAPDLESWLGLAFAPNLADLLQLGLLLSGLYVALMLVVARLLMLFSIVAAPLVIPLIAYSERTDLLVWWGRLTLGALLAPPIGSVVIGVTAVLASNGGSVVPWVPGLGSAIAVIGGFMLLGQALRQLTVHTFQIGHGMSTATMALAMLAGKTALGTASPPAAVALAGGSAADAGRGQTDERSGPVSAGDAELSPRKVYSAAEAQALAASLSRPTAAETDSPDGHRPELLEGLHILR